MIDWKEVQDLYDQLMKSRGELAWTILKDSNLRCIRDEATEAISRQLDALEKYVAPHRTTPTPP